MTNNKMPVVGERYRRKFDNKRTFIVVKVMADKNSSTGCEQYDIRDENDLNYRAFFRGEWNYDELTFKDEFEEIPNNSQKPSEVQVKKSILSDEVREAMGELKDSCKLSGTMTYHYQEIKRTSQNLLNALESMDKPNIPEKGCGIVEDWYVGHYSEAPREGYCQAGKELELTIRRYAEKNIGEDQRIYVKSEESPKNQVEEDCELEQAADEWNTEIVEEEKKSEEEFDPERPFCQKCRKYYKTLPDPNNKGYNIGKPSCDCHKPLENPKSIWKDVSESSKEYDLDQGQFVFVNMGGRISLEDIENVQIEFEKHQECCIYSKYATLTDFINHIDSLTESRESEKQKRIELEQRLNKLEGK